MRKQKKQLAFDFLFLMMPQKRMRMKPFELKMQHRMRMMQIELVCGMMQRGLMKKPAFELRMPLPKQMTQSATANWSIVSPP